MSPLAYGPGPGSHRVLGIRTQDRCRTHRVSLGPRVRKDFMEEAAALRLAADAVARLPEGVDLPSRRPATDRQARCPECVRELAEAAAARVHGDSPQ